MDKMTNINELLPDNILLDILRFLPVKERCVAGRVCRRWRNVVSDNSLWRHVNLLEYNLDLQRMWKILRAHFSECLISFRMSGFAKSELSRKRKKSSMSDSMLKELSNRCPNLSVLELQKCNTENIDYENIPLSICDLGITFSSWKHRWLKDKEHHLPKLTSLTLSHTVRIDRFDLQDISQFTQLKSLNLDNCYRIQGGDFEIITKQLKKLESLSVNHIKIGDLGMHHIAHDLRNLKTFSAYSCEMTDSMLSSVRLCLGGLISLDISFNKALSLNEMKNLCYLEKLKILKLALLSHEDKLAVQHSFSHQIVVL